MSCPRHSRCNILQPAQIFQGHDEHAGVTSIHEISQNLAHILHEVASIRRLGDQVQLLRKEVESLTEGVDSVSKVTSQCKIRVDETGGKLEDVIRGLSDFTSDVHTWIHNGEGDEEPTKSSAMDDSAGDEGGAEVPSKALDWMQYIDETGISLGFE
ncbi:uncharacterized protein B0I36DRAFT_430369 [Microdochium trichocladiopsis]|uniref:Uncharacterized protein n=1 Tax=Microdochium trichocladiopsis TaxID=1682393 RepID=A0A9P8Y8Q8_9PEZI|nr:uncharacterized protein B0I36DRAFT_430369 [Microdochium trichocladiopsis]KAH7033048.1 hypothetical protein B0I36DRAFT_430369 [Microdochium trichocladiopsis]